MTKKKTIKRMILIPLTNKSLFDCFKAGSLNWDQSPSNADTQDSCQSLPLPDNVYFDETSSAGKLYWCLSRVYYCSESCMPHVFVNTFQLKVPLFLFQTRSVQVSRTGSCLPILFLQ